jgi:hypothetical protein
MGKPFYSRRYYQLVSPPADTADQIAWRIRRRAAGEQACREREAKFPVLTQENAAEAIAWQEARIQELMREGGS